LGGGLFGSCCAAAFAQPNESPNNIDAPLVSNGPHMYSDTFGRRMGSIQTTI
jgi:hypothetical protein